MTKIARLLAHRLLALVACVVGCAGQHAETRPPPAPPPAEYRIGVEDLLEVSVWREPELRTVAPVKPDGHVTLPLAGEVEAAGHTARELEALVAEKLAARIASPVVSVVVKELNAPRVFVLGEVAKPGVYPLRGAMTLLQAIAVAGGLTEFADKGGIVVVRQATSGEQTRVRLDYDDALQGKQPFRLFPGDTVVVP